MFGNVHGQRGFTHGRAAGKNHQIAGMQPGGDGIKIAEAGGKPGNAALVGAQQLDALLDARHDRLHVEVAGAGVLGAVANGEDLLLGKVDQLAGLAAFGAKREIGNLAAGCDQAAQHGPLAHDVGVGHHVGRAGRVVGQGAEVEQPAHRLDLSPLAQVLAQRHHVTGPAGIHQIGNRAKDELMIFAIEIIGAQPVGNVVPATVVQHQATQHRLFGLDGIRR